MNIRCAKKEDVDKLVTFLNRAQLGTEGVEKSIDYFLLLEDKEGRLHGTLGIEPLGRIGLLRSLVMTEKAGQEALMGMFDQMLKLARKKEFDELYLATNKRASLSFFALLGFVKEETGNLPQELSSSNHVQHILTVDNSVFLKLNLEKSG